MHHKWENQIDHSISFFSCIRNYSIMFVKAVLGETLTVRETIQFLKLSSFLALKTEIYLITVYCSGAWLCFDGSSSSTHSYYLNFPKFYSKSKFSFSCFVFKRNIQFSWTLRKKHWHCALNSTNAWLTSWICFHIRMVWSICMPNISRNCGISSNIELNVLKRSFSKEKCRSQHVIHFKKNLVFNSEFYFQLWSESGCQNPREDGTICGRCQFKESKIPRSIFGWC